MATVPYSAILSVMSYEFSFLRKKLGDTPFWPRPKKALVSILAFMIKAFAAILLRHACLT